MNDDQRPGPIVPWAPDRVHTTDVPPLPSTFEQYLHDVGAPAPEGHPLRRTMLEHALSLPLTVLGALERFGLFPKYSKPKDKNTLTIHVLGAVFDYEPVAGGMAFEEVCPSFEFSASPWLKNSLRSRSCTTSPASSTSRSFSSGPT